MHLIGLATLAYLHNRDDCALLPNDQVASARDSRSPAPQRARGGPSVVGKTLRFFAGAIFPTGATTLSDRNAARRETRSAIGRRRA